MPLAAQRWPRPADPDAAGRLLERFAALGPAEAAWAGSPSGGALLACLGGNSPYLSDLALREHEALLRLRDVGPDAVAVDALAALAATDPAQPRPRVAGAMRRAKRQVALTVAVADQILHGGDLVDLLKDYARSYPDAGYGGTFLRWSMSDENEPYGSWAMDRRCGSAPSASPSTTSTRS